MGYIHVKIMMQIPIEAIVDRPHRIAQLLVAHLLQLRVMIQQLVRVLVLVADELLGATLMPM